MLRIVGRIFKRVGLNLWHFSYNEDRAIASIAGAPPQETVSSELGRHRANPVDNVAAALLDDIQKNHVEIAVVHANALDAADDGKEQ